jgi:hypothetical protein|tara:strand:+ start:381 stop:605 length:225 start_codon:yes stop_codon:yes gene_type:complete
MPIWLRKFTYNEIIELRKAESDAISKSTKSKKGNIDLNNPKKITPPKHSYSPPTNKGFKKPPSSPSYIAKASKK